MMSLDLFYGEATCIDVSHFEPRTYITASDIDATIAKHGADVRKGDILLFFTATFNKVYSTAEYVSMYPGTDESASMWIVEKGIKTFGVDSPSPDNPASRTYPCHMMCRKYGITHYAKPGQPRSSSQQAFHLYWISPACSQWHRFSGKSCGANG